MLRNRGIGHTRDITQTMNKYAIILKQDDGYKSIFGSIVWLYKMLVYLSICLLILAPTSYHLEAPRLIACLPLCPAISSILSMAGLLR